MRVELPPKMYKINEYTMSDIYIFMLGKRKHVLFYSLISGILILQNNTLFLGTISVSTIHLHNSTT